MSSRFRHVAQAVDNFLKRNRTGPSMTKALFFCLSGCAWAGFFVVRFAESIFPLRVLSLLLWPMAAVWGLTEIGKQRRAIASWRRLGDVMPSSTRAKIWFWQAVAAHHARFVYLFPSGLAAPRWFCRC